MRPAFQRWHTHASVEDRAVLISSASCPSAFRTAQPKPKSTRNIFGESEVCRAIDGDAVVIIDPHQIIETPRRQTQPPMKCPRRGLHQNTARKNPLRHRIQPSSPSSMRAAIIFAARAMPTEFATPWPRTRRHLDAGGHPDFRVPGRIRVPLTEI